MPKSAPKNAEMNDQLRKELIYYKELARDLTKSMFSWVHSDDVGQISPGQVFPANPSGDWSQPKFYVYNYKVRYFFSGKLKLRYLDPKKISEFNQNPDVVRQQLGTAFFDWEKALSKYKDEWFGTTDWHTIPKNEYRVRGPAPMFLQVQLEYTDGGGQQFDWDKTN